MSTSPLNLETIELVSTLRTAPLNGSPSSQDYNDCEREQLTDLAAVVSFLNDTVRVLLNSLPNTAMLPISDPVGVEGRTIYCDTSDTSSLFFSNGSPLSIADSLRVLNGMLQTFKTTLSNQTVQLAALQSRLATTNQNDVSAVLNNFSGQITSILNTIQNLEAEINAIEVVAGLGAGGSNVLPRALTEVPYSATPTFDCSPSSGLLTFQMALSGDVTAPVVINQSSAQVVTFLITQQGVGGHAFTWPSNVHNAAAISTTPGSTTSQSFTVDATGNMYPISPNTPAPIVPTTGATTVPLNSNRNITSATNSVFLCTSGSGGITLTLPSAVPYASYVYYIKKVDTGVGSVNIITTSSQTIDSNIGYNLVNKGQFVQVVSDGSNWQVIGAN